MTGIFSTDGNLPMRTDQITPEWLTAALQCRYPGTVVEGMETVEVRSGHTTKMRLKLDLNQAGTNAGIPRDVCLKANLSGDPLSSPVCVLEAHFYHDVRDDISVPAPACYYAGWNEGGDPQGVVIMEDLVCGGGEFGHSTRPVNIAEAAKALEGLADLHAGWWDSPKLDQHPWLEASMFARVDTEQYNILSEYIGINLKDERYIPVLPQWLLDDPARLGRAFDRLTAYEQAQTGPRCLIHGDAHLGNSFARPDGQRIWFDWQLARKGRPWRDITYFLIGSLTVEDRRAGEHDLLRHYRDSLAARGVPDLPDMNWVFDQYRRWPVYGMVSWLSNMDHWGQIGLPAVVRFYTAADDHNTLALIERA